MGGLLNKVHKTNCAGNVYFAVISSDSPVFKCFSFGVAKERREAVNAVARYIYWTIHLPIHPSISPYIYPSIQKVIQ